MLVPVRPVPARAMSPVRAMSLFRAMSPVRPVIIRPVPIRTLAGNFTPPVRRVPIWPLARMPPVRPVRVRLVPRPMCAAVLARHTFRSTAMSHRRMHHRRDREPVHQDHQAQARQVSSVMGVEQGGAAWGKRGGAVAS